MRVSRLASLGLAAALTTGIVTSAVPASAAPPAGNKSYSSLAALTEWLKTHDLQDWLNFLAITNPPRPDTSNKTDQPTSTSKNPAPGRGNKDHPASSELTKKPSSAGNRATAG